MKGHTTNYIEVTVENVQGLENAIVTVQITGQEGNGLRGTRVV